MAKTNHKTEKLDIKYCQVVNSERNNHYIALANDLPFAEVSGETLLVLDLNTCGVNDQSGNLLSKVFLEKKGVNINEVRERYRALRDNKSNLNQQNLSTEDRKKAMEKLEKDYFTGCRKIKVNFGFEKLLCIREWLSLKASEGIFLNRFQGDALEKTRKYRIQNILKKQE